MTVPPAIPFALSAVLLVWAVASAAMAFTGSALSGHHRVATGRPPQDPPAL